ncbi:hypothetical protein CRUP_005636 [Coryphaenoides rupestris]|nr:hypothetical protein CRUP_005636 [Coryphaenoides rupestris]
MLSKMLVCSLDRPDDDRQHVSTLVHALRADGLITAENFMQAFLSVLDQCPKIEVDVPLVKSYLAQFAARAVIGELVSVSELAHPLENGTHFPLFLLCLQQTAKLRDREWLTDLFQQSKVNMQKMLPEIDQNKDRMLEVLEGKGLSFLFPLLKLEKELLLQIQADPSPQAIYKWIKDNISPRLHTDKGFVNILMTSFLQYISLELSIVEGSGGGGDDDQLSTSGSRGWRPPRRRSLRTTRTERPTDQPIRSRHCKIDQNKDRMLEVLEGKGLSFLFPLLKLEKELLLQIQADPSPQAIYKWIKDNISPRLHTDKGFVNILMTSFLQYISLELSIVEGSGGGGDDDQLSAPTKEQLEQEKVLLLAFKPVMQKFLHDHTQLQVNQWLTWLETAEEEESEDDAD